MMTMFKFPSSPNQEQKRRRLLQKAGDLSDEDLLWLLRRQQQGNP